MTSINGINNYNKIDHINWQPNPGNTFANTKVDKVYDDRYLEIARHFRELARLFEDMAEVKTK